MSRQVGRGGTRGKTSGRGTKGQNARAGHKKRPELRDIIKTLPKLRGRGKNSFKSFAIKPSVVNVGVLEAVLETGTTVTPVVLMEHGLVKMFQGVTPRVKILADGDLSKKFTISGCLVSMEAKGKIEKAGGTIKLN